MKHKDGSLGALLKQPMFPEVVSLTESNYVLVDVIQS